MCHPVLWGINEDINEWSTMAHLWKHLFNLLIIQVELNESSLCQRMKCRAYCLSTTFFFYFIEDSCYKTEFGVFSFLSLLFIFIFLFFFCFFLQNKPITVLQIIQINTSFTGIPSIYIYTEKNIKKKNKSPSEITVVRAKKRGVFGCGWTI